MRNDGSGLNKRPLSLVQDDHILGEEWAKKWPVSLTQTRLGDCLPPANPAFSPDQKPRSSKYWHDVLHLQHKFCRGSGDVSRIRFHLCRITLEWPLSWLSAASRTCEICQLVLKACVGFRGLCCDTPEPVHVSNWPCCCCCHGRRLDCS